jgi:hypothetical protein
VLDHATPAMLHQLTDLQQSGSPRQPPSAPTGAESYSSSSNTDPGSRNPTGSWPDVIRR